MKTTLLFILIILDFASTAQKSLNIIGEGSQLIYNVTESKTKYKLTVTIKQLKDYGIDVILDWKTEGDKQQKGTLIIPKANLSYYSKLILAAPQGTVKLKKEALAFFYPGEFLSVKSSLEVNDVTFNMSKDEDMEPNIVLEYNKGRAAFPYWKIVSKSSYPDVDYTLTVAGIKAKLDDKSDNEGGGSPYKQFLFIQYVACNDFEMKLEKIITP